MTIRDTVSATGVVEPRELVLVGSKAPGMVMRLSGLIGESVKETDLLAQLDDREIILKIEEANTGIKAARAAVMQAEAMYGQAVAGKEAAKHYFERQKKLENMGGFTTELEQARAQFEAAVAGVKAAKAGIEVARAKKQNMHTVLREAQLAHELTRIKVPSLSHLTPDQAKREFIILDRKVHEGQIVGPQAGPMFTLAGSLDIVELHAQVVEGDVSRIKPGLKVSFKIKNYNEEDADFEDGEISTIRPLSTNIKGAIYYDAVIVVKNRRDPVSKQWQLRPGMTASIDIVRDKHENVWQVPQALSTSSWTRPTRASRPGPISPSGRNAPTPRTGRPLWTWDEATRQPQPVFVRIGARQGEVGLKDSEGNEILEWEPGKQPTGPIAHHPRRAARDAAGILRSAGECKNLAGSRQRAAGSRNRTAACCPLPAAC